MSDRLALLTNVVLVSFALILTGQLRQRTLDQLGVVGPKQCFTKSHGHKTPADAEGRMELIRGIARHMKKLDPAPPCFSGTSIPMKPI